MAYNDQKVTFIYHLNQSEKYISINGKTIESDGIANPYRNSGFIVKQNVLEEEFTEEDNKIDIFL